jgi:hypothetical protein
VDYKIGGLNEARPSLGKTMVQETYFKAPYAEPIKSSDLNSISLNPSWLDLDYMEEGKGVVSADSEYGVINVAHARLQHLRLQ